MAVKKYQIFLSSTFLDLQIQRSAAVTATMRLGHIPVGMELFPATDKKQWAVIEKAIRESDYYVLMVGARYGSLLGEISYTEAEYDFALSEGVPVIPLLLKGHEEAFRSRSDEDAEALSRLNKFRKKLEANHTCQYWADDAELSALLFQGILDAIDQQHREGWIRGSAAASEDTLNELSRITKERDSLASEVERISAQLTPSITSLAGFEDEFDLRYEYSHYYQGSSGKRESSVKITWGEILCGVGPKLMNSVTPREISSSLYNYVRENKNVGVFPKFFESDLATIKIQLISLGLIESYNAKAINAGITEFIRLTEHGRARLAELITKRRLQT